jgi:uncharacterized OB-fold protein
MENQFTINAYNEYLKEHRLMGSRDISSGELFLPPRPLNPFDYSTDMEWVEFSGNGELQAFTSIYINSTAMNEVGYNRSNPCVVGIIKTAEGPMISALVVGLNGTKPQNLKIGTPLKVKFIDHGGEGNRKTLLAFEPA